MNADGTTTFVFTVSSDKQGVSIPAVTGFSDGSWDTTQTYFLNIPNFGRTFDLSYYTDGTYDLFGNAYAQLQRSSNRSFPVDSDSKLIVSRRYRHHPVGVPVQDLRQAVLRSAL